METRKGWLTRNQEKGIDKITKLKGFAELADGPAIRITDNILLEQLKAYTSEEAEQFIYKIIDELFRSLGIEP